MRFRASRLTAILVMSLIGAAACSAPGSPTPHEGKWHAWLDSPGGALPFGIELARDGEDWSAALRNGPERLEVERTRVEGATVELFIDRYDSSVTATLSADGTRLDGTWRKTAGREKQSTLPFHATAGGHRRFVVDPDPAPAGDLDGRWRVVFDRTEDPAVGLFDVRDDGSVGGTFLTTTGDYRFLEGNLDGDRLRLSAFDGAHAFLFDARLLSDGSLEGDFWSRDNWHEGWRAVRDPDAALPNAFAQTSWVEHSDLGTVVFPGLDGQPRRLDDPAFAGRARMIVVFGTWCPNCNDATAFLVELDDRYRDRGLSIVGLAFEMTGEFERDAAQVKRYAAYHGIRYPLLVAGTSDKAEASAAFPLIDRIRSFPTTIFMHSDGRVRAVHSGFSGPATGPGYDAQRREFIELVEELLQETIGRE